MSKTIRKTSFCLAFLMAFMMVFSLLPLNVKAQESITLTRADLDAVKADPQSAIAEEKGIKHFENGAFQLTKSAEYILGGDISLDGESLDFDSLDGPSVLNLNGHTISCVNGIVETYGDETIYYGAVESVLYGLTIKGNGTITVDDKTQIAVNAYGDLTIEGGTYDGVIVCNDFWGPDYIMNITGGVFKDGVSATAPAIVYGGTFEDKVVFNGSTTIEGGRFEGKTDFNESAIINDGVFIDDVTANDEIEINGGQFGEDVPLQPFVLSLNKQADINGGIFNKYIYVRGFVVIDDGDFCLIREMDDDATLIINGGHFSNTLSVEGGYCVIEDGSFEYDEVGFGAAIDLTDADLVINGGQFINKDDSSNRTMYNVIRAVGSDDPDEFTSLIISGGKFGECRSVALWINNIDFLTITGGEFIGKHGGLLINDLGNSVISLEGGRFTASEGSDDDYSAAISVYNCENGVYNEIDYKDHYFDDYLAEGFVFSPTSETNKAMDGDKIIALYTQQELQVLPKENDIVIDDGGEDLNEQVNVLVDKIKAGESVEGISPELAEEILNAVAEGKEINVSMNITAVNPEDVADDAAKVTALVGEDGNILSYFDINISVSIDGEHKGFITKLDDGVIINLPIPENLPAVPDGFVRVFKIVNVHNGVAKDFNAESKDGYASAKVSEFSTYALVYQDVKAAPSDTPSTGDSGFAPWLIVLGAAAASAVIVIKNRKFKSE